jgi:hypothetical protein
VREEAVPICHDRVITSEFEIREMLDALPMAPLPVPARGVAMASWLLIDGAGPVYNVCVQRASSPR